VNIPPPGDPFEGTLLVCSIHYGCINQVDSLRRSQLASFQNSVEHHEDTDVPLPELREHVRVQYMVVIEAKHEPGIVRQDGIQVVLGDLGNLEFKALEQRLDVMHGFLARDDNYISHSIQRALGFKLIWR
jgi:hypothetical protein